MSVGENKKINGLFYGVPKALRIILVVILAIAIAVGGVAVVYNTNKEAINIKLVEMLYPDKYIDPDTNIEYHTKFINKPDFSTPEKASESIEYYMVDENGKEVQISSETPLIYDDADRTVAEVFLLLCVGRLFKLGTATKKILPIAIAVLSIALVCVLILVWFKKWSAKEDLNKQNTHKQQNNQKKKKK